MRVDGQLVFNTAAMIRKAVLGRIWPRLSARRPVQTRLTMAA